MAQDRAGHLTPAPISAELGVSLSRFDQLRTEYLLAHAQGQAEP
jgi:hypothetical protein